ncbi:hypothetical protein FRACYDRAFT_270706 [Fragilariopsis cylindrus CCMP1102]|uniref:Uncharacterized protein n=1 Tax=Fragilariopsis cylindrus CCMP1102 TaxID=635003 RepID=A0A1E7F1G7_9STRA|nr:hypothetical protein FRACYDRAFT_270706 [Fragilariopsis cylindrus CCMP1102]|eukprot:OEU11969.1 hypothetical protein FRACYDRAFT_270706 [Fragilariopsis cylindrus CCMP1102]
MMNTNNNNDTNSMTVIDSTNSNKDVGEEEDKEGIKEEEEIKDNSIHNDHHKGVNDANNSFSLSSGDIEEYTTLRPSSPTSTTPSSPTRNPLMRIINPLVGVFRSGDNNNSSLKDDDDDEGEDQDEDDSNGIVETPGNSDSPSSSSSNNTKNRMDLQQKIMNLRHNVAELRQQLKYAVTDEEKDLFRQSIASQRHVLARMSSISLDIDDSEDSLFGFPGDGTATGTDTDTYSNRYTIPNNNGSSSSNNNTCSNNKNSNSNKRVDSCANNAYQRSPLDVINDDSTCSKGDDGNYDNDDTDINDSLSSIGLDNKVENKD